jgi:predicted phage terminase large subunit-like protein
VLRELLERKRAQESLVRFTEATCDWYVPAAHHKAIAEKLEAIERGEIDRLMINMPPRHGKSELASRRFPAWFLGRHPGKSIIAASYNSDLATDFGRQVRNIIAAEEYKAIFKTELAEDSRAANRWNTAEGGGYVAAGVGTAITGRGADCLAPWTLVATNFGDVRVDELQYIKDCKILSYSEANGRLEYKSLQAVASRTADGLYRITTQSGRVVEVTGNHPVYVGGRYVPADHVAPGDIIVCALREDVHAAGLPIPQEYRARARRRLLQQRVLGSAPRDQKQIGVQGVWWAGGKARARILPAVQAETKGQGRSLSSGLEVMPHVQQRVSGGLAREIGRKARHVLQQGVRRTCAFAANVGKGEPQVEAWGYAFAGAASFSESVQDCASPYPGAGWPRLRRVFGIREASRSASHRQLANEQRSIEPSNIVFPMPSEVARGEGFKAVRDVVALVERVRQETVVYDIQVEGNHNLFANGVLVHNCLLIDDPLKDREEADSELQRQKVWDWYTSTAYTRLAPGGRVILIQTRWHADDLSGRLIAEEERGGDKWEKLELPAINDNGEALWPEFYPIETLERYRKVLPIRDWSALYQQRPTPDEGAYFKREWFRFYDAMPTNLRTYGASDYAVTAKGGDYTVHVVAGVDPDDNIFIIDVWRSQAETHHWVDAYIDLIARWKPLMWAQESGQIIKSLGPFIDRRMRERRVYCAQEQMTSVADKPTRARSFQARAAMGKVYLPHNAPWVADLMGELLTFPAGRHDDQVDALGLIGRMVDKMVGGRAPRVEATPTDKWRRAFARRAEADNSSNDWKTA